MKNKLMQKTLQKGSLMVEALAMLGLIAMVTPMVYKKTAERTSEMQDINEAGHLRVVSRAFDDYLTDNYNDDYFKYTSSTPDDTKYLDVDADDVAKYFPQGFTLQSKLFGDLKFKAHVRAKVTNDGTDEGIETSPKVLTGFVVATPQTNIDIPLMRASRIASMIGTNGGFVDGDTVKGVQGIWSIDTDDVIDAPTEEGETVNNNGAIVTSSIQSIADSAGGSDLLYRTYKGNETLNTMETNLLMGGYNIEGAGDITADTATIGPLTITADEVKTSEKLTISDGGADITGELLAKTGATVSGGLLNAEAGASIKGTTEGTDNTLTVEGASEFTGKVTITDGSSSSEEGSAGIGNNAYNTNIIGGLYVEGGFATDDIDVVNKFRAGQNVDGSDADNDFTFVVNGDDLDPGIAINKGSINLASEVGLSSDYFNIIDSEDSSDKGVTIGLYNETDGYPIMFDADGNMDTIANITAPYFETGYDDDDNLFFSIGDGTTTNPILDIYNDTTYGNIIDIVSDQFNLTSQNAIMDQDGFAIGNTLSLNDSNEITGDIRFEVDTTTNGVITARGQMDFMDGEETESKTLQVGTLNDDPSGNVGSSNPYVYIRNGGVHIAGDHDAGNATTHTLGTVPDAFTTAGGYINVDRIITNTTYTKDSNYSTNNDYDRFQVNPAYTSVMNDIKLATRGGARLSDILPDFITKGVYVLDNTYKNTTKTGSSGNSYYGTFNWTSLNSAISGTDNFTSISETPDACTEDDAPCEASPWLGFLPAPQCPPGYSKIATATPLRFNMGQTYAVDHNYTGTDPYAMLYRNTNPTMDNANYLGFQASTWLNLYLEENTGTFKGWHTVMGFIYPVADYCEYITKILGSAPSNCSSNDTIIWNLLPVYNQELAAIVTTYCHFERENFTGNEYVDPYEQLTNYQSNKDDFTDTVNDPDLGYKDVW
ncbi:MAG: hypothetical protein R3Y43_01725 [Alphaproteobacteria bacterium]